MALHIDVQETGAKKSLDTPGGDEMMKRLGGDKAGLPFIAFLDAKGSLLVNGLDHGGANVGYPYELSEVEWFMAMLTKGAPAMTAEERSILEKYLRGQKK